MRKPIGVGDRANRRAIPSSGMGARLRSMGERSGRIWDLRSIYECVTSDNEISQAAIMRRKARCSIERCKRCGTYGDAVVSRHQIVVGVET